MLPCRRQWNRSGLLTACRSLTIRRTDKEARRRAPSPPFQLSFGSVAPLEISRRSALLKASDDLFIRRVYLQPGGLLHPQVPRQIFTFLFDLFAVTSTICSMIWFGRRLGKRHGYHDGPAIICTCANKSVPSTAVLHLLAPPHVARFLTPSPPFVVACFWLRLAHVLRQ